MEGIFNTILSLTGSFSFFVPLIFKYTLIIGLSAILSVIIYYYKRSWGRFIAPTGFICILFFAVIKIYIESDPGRILHYSGYKYYPINRFLWTYGLFGMTYFWVTYFISEYNSTKFVKKIRSWMKK